MENNKTKSSGFKVKQVDFIVVMNKGIVEKVTAIDDGNFAMTHFIEQAKELGVEFKEEENDIMYSDTVINSLTTQAHKQLETTGKSIHWVEGDYRITQRVK